MTILKKNDKLSPLTSLILDYQNNYVDIEIMQHQLIKVFDQK